MKKIIKDRNVNFRVTEDTYKKLDQLSKIYDANHTMTFELALELLDQSTDKSKSKINKK